MVGLRPFFGGKPLVAAHPPVASCALLACMTAHAPADFLVENKPQRHDSKLGQSFTIASKHAPSKLLFFETSFVFQFKPA